MVELFHRRFAPERHPEREARELFAKTPDSGPPMPEGMNLESLMNPESRVPGAIQDNTRSKIRAMAAADHGGSHANEGGDHGDGEHAEGHSEHAPRAVVVYKELAAFHTELLGKLKQFDNPELKKLLPDGAARQAWARERNTIDSMIAELQSTINDEAQPLVDWQTGEMSPTEFGRWISSTRPPEAPLSKDQRRQAYHESYTATEQRIEKDKKNIQHQLEEGSLDSAGLDNLHTRLVELDEEKIEAQRRLRQALQALENEREPKVRQGDTLSREERETFYTQQKLLKGELGNIISKSRGHPVEEFDVNASTLPSDYLPDLRNGKWETYNTSTRQAIVERIGQNPLIGGLVATKLLMLSEILKRMKERVKEGAGNGQILEEVENADKEEKKNRDKEAVPQHRTAGPMEQWKDAWNTVGVKFYSVKGIMEGGHLWWEAWKGAMHKYQHREGSLFASFLGKSTKHLPFGEEVEVELEQNVDKADDQAKDEYLDVLKRRNTNFRNLVEGSHSELARNFADKNRTRAILEYAASRGWLYDLLNNKKASDGWNSLFGYSIYDLIPEDWKFHTARINDYVSKLTTEQSSGQDAEQKKYKERYQHVHKTSDFIRLMDDELDDMNMFGALGIMQRSLERGLTGYVTNWHAIRMMRRIQHNPLFRKYLTDTFLDKFGNMSLYNTHGRLAGSLTKLHRHQILKELNDSEREGREFDLHNAIDQGDNADSMKFYLDTQKHLEKELYHGRRYESMSKSEQKEFDEKLSQFTSGSITEKDKKKLSIFNKKFDYWTAVDVGQGQMSIKEEDEDYFRAPTWGKNHGSVTALLADETVVKQIMSKTGDGQFTHEARARYMADSIVTNLEYLEEEHLMAERENFRIIMGNKIDPLYRSYVSDTRAPGLADQKMIRPQYKSGERTPYVLLEFLRLGLIQPQSLIKTIKQTGGTLSLNIIGQAIAFGDKMEASNPGIMTQIKAMYDEITDPKERKIIDDRIALEKGSGPRTRPSTAGHDDGAGTGIEHALAG